MTPEETARRIAKRIQAKHPALDFLGQVSVRETIAAEILPLVRALAEERAKVQKIGDAHQNCWSEDCTVLEDLDKYLAEPLAALKGDE